MQIVTGASHVNCSEVLGWMTGDDWTEIWKELRRNIASQPRCPEHPEHPCVHTLLLGVTNDILAVREAGLLVRSHRTMNQDFIPARRIERWWRHLIAHGTASIQAGDPNNPRRWRARLVGAVLAAGLPGHVRYAGDNTLEYIGEAG